VARAQRWNTNARNLIQDSNPVNQSYVTDLRNKLLPATVPPPPDPSTEIAYITGVYKKTGDALANPLSLVCDPPAAPCPAAGPLVYLVAGDPKLHICPSWITQSPDDQILTMLTALYGSLGGETRADWQLGMAKMAQSITTAAFGPPVHAEIIGNPAWTKDSLSLLFRLETRIPGAKPLYVEGTGAHQRLSADVPVYQSPFCDPALPFAFSGTFFVDNGGNRRPGPFTPPTLTIEYAFQSEVGKNTTSSGRVEDTHPLYQGEGVGLKTPLAKPIQLAFSENGTFRTQVRMFDPETSTTVEYDDSIQVIAGTGCNMKGAERRA
jgi:hypothetical protein